MCVQSSVIEMLMDDDAVGNEEVVSEVYVSTTDDSTEPVSVPIFHCICSSSPAIFSVFINVFVFYLA